jgi:hypothetical protein
MNLSRSYHESPTIFCSDMTARAHFQLLVQAELKVGIRQNHLAQYVDHDLDKSKSRVKKSQKHIYLKLHSPKKANKILEGFLP